VHTEAGQQILRVIGRLNWKR